MARPISASAAAAYVVGRVLRQIEDGQDTDPGEIVATWLAKEKVCRFTGNGSMTSGRLPAGTQNSQCHHAPGLHRRRSGQGRQSLVSLAKGDRIRT